MAKHSLKRLRFFSLVIILCVVAAFLSVAKIIPRPSPQDDLLGLFDACAGRSGKPFDYACMRSGLTVRISTDTLPDTMMRFEEIFARPDITFEQYGGFTCHPVAHMAGEIAIKKNMSFSDVNRLCGRMCDYGCVHGAFVQQMRQDDRFVEQAGALCEDITRAGAKRELISCAHAVGHGLSETSGKNTLLAIERCRFMPDDQARHSCGQGVIMDSLIGLPDNPLLNPLAADDIFALCAQLSAPFGKECYDNAGMYAAKTTRDQFDALSFCDGVPPDSRASCVYSLGSAVYFVYRQAPVDLLAYCRHFDGALFLSCVTGAIETSIGEEDAFAYGRVVCESLKNSERTTCFSFLGDQLFFARGQDDRQSICNALLAEDKTACL